MPNLKTLLQKYSIDCRLPNIFFPLNISDSSPLPHNSKTLYCQHEKRNLMQNKKGFSYMELHAIVIHTFVHIIFLI